MCLLLIVVCKFGQMLTKKLLIVSEKKNLSQLWIKAVLRCNGAEGENFLFVSIFFFQFGAVFTQFLYL